MSRAEGTYRIINELGLHARPAAQLVKVANRYPCEVELECEGQTANGKSIMGVLMLAAGPDMQLTIRCNGQDAEACLAELAQLIASRFGEPR